MIPKQTDRIYIVGAGGHAKVVVDILLAMERRPTACLADQPGVDRVLGIPVLMSLDAPEADAEVIVAIGDNGVRSRLASRYTNFGVAIHPMAYVGRDVQIGAGSVVMAGAVVNAGTRIGRHVIINTNASVDHDCIIDDFASIGPAATLGGSVIIREAAIVALGGKVLHGRTIGRHALLGAGAVATHDVPDCAVAIGVPARIARQRDPQDPYL